MTKKNAGKEFEDQWRDSYLKYDHLFLRLQDGAKWNRGIQQSFTTENPFDSLGYQIPFLWFLELKSTKDNLISFTPFGDDCSPYEKPKERNGKRVADKMIKTNQVKSLMKYDKYEGVICGFIFNFRDEIENKTFFIHIKDFLEFASTSKKSSINIKDCISIGLPIESRKKIKKHTYNIEKFCSDSVNFSINKKYITTSSLSRLIKYINSLVESENTLNEGEAIV